MSSALDVGVVGLGVMGRSLALNMIDHGQAVGGSDLSHDNVRLFTTEGAAKARGFAAARELARALARPRRILIMVPAGPAVDAVVQDLAAVLEPGDIVIDGGNSRYQDTQRRIEAASQRGILFVGAGVSGGEEGARRGPSIMPGGAERAWPHIAPMLRAIAARGPDGEPCCDWLGGGGCGHAVKTVHNGIEYAFMQAICEAYGLLARTGIGPDDLARTFGSWNTGDMRSFLLEITEQIFTVRDGAGPGRLVDAVLDEAQQKGTGKWTAEMALDLGVPCPTLAEAVFARGVSARQELRKALAAAHPGPPASAPARSDLSANDLRDALLTTIVIAFAQGLDLIGSASEAYGWGVRLDRVARLWRAGCIIRIAMLDQISEAMRGDGATHLLLDPWFASLVGRSAPGLRRAVAAAAASGVGCPAMASALAYYDTARAARLPHNLLQAQRDAFGAHTYRRIDRPGVFHTDWLGDGTTSTREAHPGPRA